MPAFGRDACCGKVFQFLGNIFKQDQIEEVDNKQTVGAKPGSFLFHEFQEVMNDDGMNALQNSSSSGDDYMEGNEIIEPIDVWEHDRDGYPNSGFSIERIRLDENRVATLYVEVHTFQ